MIILRYNLKKKKLSGCISYYGNIDISVQVFLEYGYKYDNLGKSEILVDLILTLKVYSKNSKLAIRNYESIQDIE